MGRTIKVTGKGKVSVKPDTIRLIITQTNVVKDYEATIKESADMKASLNESLVKIGFEKDDLKTLMFNIDTETESYQANDKSWKQRMLGYRYTHRMKLEFPSDSNMLGKILATVANSVGKPEFSISYTVKDPEAAKNELLRKAVEDSKAKAEVLTKAAGVSLGNIMSIDYSWGEIEFETRPINDLKLRSFAAPMVEFCDSIDIDIEADDIDVTDTVTVVWDII